MKLIIIRRTLRFVYLIFLAVSLLFLSSFPSEAEVVAEFRQEGLKNGVFLPVAISEKTYKFLVDTGSTFTALNSSFKPFLGKPLTSGKVATTVGQSGVEYYSPIDITTTGDINIKTNLPYISADFNFFSKVVGTKFDGIVGMAFLHKYIWDINFDDNTFRMLSAIETPEHLKNFSSINMSSSVSGVPLVPVEAGGERLLFMLDTGDTGSGRLTGEVIDFLYKNNLIESTMWDTSVSLSGITKIRRVRVREIGPDTYSGLIMQESNQNALGLRFLSRHHVKMDFPNQKLHLRKGLGSFHSDRLDKSGLKLISDNGSLVVAFVDMRGPAIKAGILQGDIITSVNNSSTSGKNLTEVREILKGQDGEKVFLVIKRSDIEIKSTVVLDKSYNFIKP